MKKRGKIYRGPIEGTKIELASTEEVESHFELANELMKNIFDVGPGEYLITDEPDLRDFTDFGASDTSGIWASIEEHFHIDRADVGSERLVRIFSAIVRRRIVQ